MKKNIVRIIAVCMMIILTGLSVAGCSHTVLDGEQTVATINEEEISLAVANFYTRYIYQIPYDMYLTFMGDDMYEQEMEEGVTYEEYVKGTAMDAVKQMYILNAVKETYGVALTAAEEQEIAETAKQFMEDNDQEAIEVMTATEDVAKEVLTLFAISHKVTEEIKALADRDVSDEEAAQKKMLYASITNPTSTDSEEETVTLTSEELKEAAEALLEQLQDGADFTETVEAAGYTVTEQTFDAESTAPTEAVVEAADQLEEGGLTEVIASSDETTYYIAYLESEFDREATDTKIDTIISDRENDKFEEVYKELEEEFEFVIKEDVWAQVSFIKQGVTAKEETDDDTTGDE